jgi:tetratricopeptide (TPR) repeat protein
MNAPKPAAAAPQGSSANARTWSPVRITQNPDANASGAGVSFRQLPGELDELIQGNRWQEMVDRFYPVEEKLADMKADGLKVQVRSKLAFALGQLSRFDEAIAELTWCVDRFPDNFVYRSGLAYNAYNSLYAARDSKQFLRGEARRERIELAHTHFRETRRLRPDGVTCFYRQGMLFYRIEDKPREGLPLFQQAIRNWDRLDASARETRHQERKNYVKSLYQAASASLHLGQADAAFELIQRCLTEDEASNHLHRLFKYFALGKVQFARGRYAEARDACRFALRCKEKHQNADFVQELLARSLLAMERVGDALAAVEAVPEHRRRPYIRWTEADILCVLGRVDDARRILVQSADRDRMSRHKTLILLARIEFWDGRFDRALQCAEVADRFFREKWGNPYIEGCFWQAMSALKLGRRAPAEKAARILETEFPNSRRWAELKAALDPPEKAVDE